MTSIHIRENAENFAVYRMGANNDWEATYDEVAQVTGLSVARVKAICIAKAWRFTSPEDAVPSLDSIMQPTIGLDASLFHV